MLFKTKKRERIKLDDRIKKDVDFYFDDSQWTIRYAVADKDRKASGRKVLISPEALTRAFKKEHLITANLSKKKTGNRSSFRGFDLDSSRCEVDYSQYYGSPHYWGGEECWGNYPRMIGGPILTNIYNKDLEKKSDTHLRSISEVATYQVHATDGEIGHVEDFIIKDKTWEIQYLIVRINNIKAEKKVLISPSWIERVSRVDKEVYVNHNRQEVVSAAEYTDAVMLKGDHELSRY